MTNDMADGVTRRAFLGAAVALAGAAPFIQHLEATVAAQRPAAPHYRALTRAQGAFSEKLVNVLCPADQWTPNGVTCGLVQGIDHCLVANSDAARLYTAGSAAADRACQRIHGVTFAQLPDRAAAELLRDMAVGVVTDPTVPLASWIQEAVYPALKNAAFTGHIHDGYSNKVFWKLFGYLGDPISYSLQSA